MLRSLALLILTGALLCAQTSVFPNALPTSRNLTVASDNAVATLTGTISTTSLSIPVDTVTNFVPYMLVSIDNEILQLCAVSAKVLTVCSGGRGINGVLRTHPKGTEVNGYLTAYQFNMLTSYIKSITSALGTNLSNVEKPVTYASPLVRSGNTVSCPTCGQGSSAGNGTWGGGVGSVTTWGGR